MPLSLYRRPPNRRRQMAPRAKGVQQAHLPCGARGPPSTLVTPGDRAPA
jgi:hypothetical protein